MKDNKWAILTDSGQIKQVLEASKERPQLVYKHSHTCGICHASLEELESKIDELEDAAGLHFVNVKKSRTVSKAVAEELDVRHESPQVLIVDDGECVWHKSHWSIKGDAVLDAL